MLIHDTAYRSTVEGQFLLQSFLGSVALTHSNYLFRHASGRHVRHIMLAYS